MAIELPIRIRPYRFDDARSAWEAVSESLTELVPWMPWCHPRYSIDESRAWLKIQVPAFQRGDQFEFAITSGDGRYLGGVGLNQIEKPNRRANLGYWVRSSASGQGVATAAVHLIREWAFHHTDLVRLEVLVAVENAPSHRVAEKSGAVREGVLRSRLLLHGAAHDAVMYSFVRPISES
jgi:RimJ/RimL family protein N-acetyltransferase